MNLPFGDGDRHVLGPWGYLPNGSLWVRIHLEVHRSHHSWSFALRLFGVLRGEKKTGGTKKKGQDENHHLVNVSGWEDILWLNKPPSKLRGSSKRI